MELPVAVIRGLELTEVEVEQLTSEGRSPSCRIRRRRVTKPIRFLRDWQFQDHLQRRYSYSSYQGEEVVRAACPEVTCSSCHRTGNLHDVERVVNDERHSQSEMTGMVIWSRERKMYSCPMCHHRGWLRVKEKEEVDAKK